MSDASNSEEAKGCHPSLEVIIVEFTIRVLSLMITAHKSKVFLADNNLLK